MCSLDFVRQLLNGQKLMVKINDVRVVNKPERYQELTVTSLLDHCRQNIPEVLRYLPEDLDPARIDRGYLLNVKAV